MSDNTVDIHKTPAFLAAMEYCDNINKRNYWSFGCPYPSVYFMQPYYRNCSSDEQDIRCRIVKIETDEPIITNIIVGMMDWNCAFLVANLYDEALEKGRKMGMLAARDLLLKEINRTLNL